MSRKSSRLNKIALNKELKTLKEAYTISENLSRYLSNKLEDVYQQNKKIVEIVERVCTNSIALPVKDTAMNNNELFPTYRVDLMDTLYAGNSFIGHERIMDCSTKRVNLGLLDTVVSTNASNMETSIHMRFHLNDGTVGYYLTREALLNMPLKHLAEYIVPDMLEKLKSVV